TGPSANVVRFRLPRCPPSPPRSSRRTRPSFPPARRAPRRHRSRAPVAHFAALRRPSPPWLANSMRQKKRGAGTSLATRIPTSSPDRSRAPPRRRAASAISLAEQFPQHALLELRRRALCSTPRPQEFQKQLFEIELLAAGRTVLEMFP